MSNKVLVMCTWVCCDVTDKCNGLHDTRITISTNKFCHDFLLMEDEHFKNSQNIVIGTCVIHTKDSPIKPNQTFFFHLVPVTMNVLIQVKLFNFHFYI